MEISYRLFLIVLIFHAASPQTYRLNTSYIGSTFFDGFDFADFKDPSHGVVDYVNRSRAEELGLISFINGKVKISVDSTNVYSSSTRGRPSIRLQSQTAYEGGLFILDVDHMPTGPGTWPAWWTTSVSNWPNWGEIDIIEGIGGMNLDQISMHTKDGCWMQDGDAIYFTGHWTQDRNKNATNCYVHASSEDYNFGCSIQASDGTFGSQWNAIGGVVALEWNVISFTRIFIFQRPQVPADINQGNPNPANWGKPVAHFRIGVNCTSDHLKEHNIILNTDLCGDWAGQVYPGGQSACANAVYNFPNLYTDAYWLINYIKVYTQ